MKRHDGVRKLVYQDLGLKDRYVLRRLIKKFTKQGHDFSGY